MILYRYINRQILATTLVVTVVLMMVLLSGRFIKYLANAASGEIAADVLIVVMLYRIPEFLQLILPLSVFIAILLALGRMYSDSEMAVLKAGGVGQLQVLRGMTAPILVTTALVGFSALYLTPHGETEVARILDEQRGRSVLELLTPGRFHVRSSRDGQRTAYAESLDRDQGVLKNIFISDYRYPDDDGAAQLVTVLAGRGRIVEQYGMTYLSLEQGVQYQGSPGDADYREVAFATAMVRVGEQQQVTRPPKVRSLDTRTLLTAQDAEMRAELQWRFSIVLLVPLMLMAAVPLSQANPRQGRFNRVAPALLVYLLYVGLLLVMRSDLSRLDEAPHWYQHMGWVHLLAGLLVLLLYGEHHWRLWWRQRLARWWPGRSQSA